MEIVPTLTKVSSSKLGEKRIISIAYIYPTAVEREGKEGRRKVDGFPCLRRGKLSSFNFRQKFGEDFNTHSCFVYDIECDERKARP